MLVQAENRRFTECPNTGCRVSGNFHTTGLCVEYHPMNARMGPRIAVVPA